MWKLCLAFLATAAIDITVRTETLKDSFASLRNSEAFSLENGPAKQRSIRNASLFYGAPKMRDVENVFDVNDTEFILISDTGTHEEAVKRCTEIYRSRLAQISTKALADFIAEALGETNLVNSSVWISAKKVDNKTGRFYWFEGDKKLEQISEELRKIIDIRRINDRYSKFIWTGQNQSLSKELHAFIHIPARYRLAKAGMDCMSIDRLYGDVPRFHPASCSRKKPILCERVKQEDEPTADPGRSLESTHPGWIKIDQKYCKIYAESTTWTEASEKCHSKGATLANLKAHSDCITLARFLKIGRPSLKQAWIGAKFESSIEKYKYENGIELDRLPNKNDFPPWRDGHQDAKKGCVTLDRETSTGSVFLSINCLRKRAYICCRDNDQGKDIIKTPKIDNDNNSKLDIEIDEIGYRIYYQRFSWENARDKCNSFKDKYGGKLAEIREKSSLNHLLEVMTGNLKSVFHMWIGGRYDNDKERWYWSSDNLEIPDDGMLNWVKNESFYHESEQFNQCLNMDRVIKGVEAEFYGTRCSWGQFFVCEFAREQLVQLQQNEASEKK